jgi:hypothetical protein
MGDYVWPTFKLNNLALVLFMQCRYSGHRDFRLGADTRMISFSRGLTCILVFKSWCPGKAFLEHRTIHICPIQNILRILLRLILYQVHRTLQTNLDLSIPRQGIARRPQSQFPHTCVSVSHLYILTFGPRIFLQQNKGRPIRGIYKSHTETWLQELGLQPRNFFPGNICFEFSVLCLLQCTGYRAPAP